MNNLIDVRPILPSIRVPTLVIAKVGDPLTPPGCAKDLASRIPDARVVEVPGEGHLVGESGPEIMRILREWVTEVTETIPSKRFLATILFVDLVRSTERVAQLGDGAWRDLLARYYAEARRELAIYGGVEVDTAGDGLLAHFDGPGRAVKCAGAIERARVTIEDPRKLAFSRARSKWSGTRAHCAASRCTPRRASPPRRARTRSWSRVRYATSSPDPASCSSIAAPTS